MIITKLNKLTKLAKIMATSFWENSQISTYSPIWGIAAVSYSRVLLYQDFDKFFNSVQSNSEESYNDGSDIKERGHSKVVDKESQKNKSANPTKGMGKEKKKESGKEKGKDEGET